MEILDIGEQGLWESLADRAYAPLQQRWIYGAAAEACGRAVTRRVIETDGSPTAMAQSLHRTLAGIPVHLVSRGPLSLSRETPLPLRLFSGPTLVTPEHPTGRRTGRRIAVLPLAGEQDMRAAMHGKWRNRLARAERAGHAVVHPKATPQSLAPVLHAEAAQQKANRYRALPPEFALALHAADARALRLYLCKDAAMLFIRHGNTATYHIGHAGPEGRRHNAHNLILWRAMCDLAHEGVTRIDLGPVNEATPGLTRFKLGSGAQVHTLGATRFALGAASRPRLAKKSPAEAGLCH